MIEIILVAMAVVRILLGIAPFVAVGPSLRLFGFPAQHDNATMRLMSRLFGVRDAGLGVLVFYGLEHPATLPFIILFNGLTDVGDLVAISIPLVRRQGIDRGAIASAAFALPASIMWFTIFWIMNK